MKSSSFDNEVSVFVNDIKPARVHILHYLDSFDQFVQLACGFLTGRDEQIMGVRLTKIKQLFLTVSASFLLFINFKLLYKCLQ